MTFTKKGIVRLVRGRFNTTLIQDQFQVPPVMYVIELVGKCQRLKLSTLNFGNRSEGATGGVFVPIEVRGADSVYVAITQLRFPHMAGAHLFSPPTPQTNSKEVTVCGDRS